ncbi:MAG: DUF1572 domain-containing protein [Bacteroidia bacterium]|nr:MAG: DUF1572 domain-containing protein [Bacteroidia bacterium]
MIETIFLESAIKQFNDYKELGEKTFAQLQESDFYYQPNEYTNSLAQQITHLHGNMLSRWTHFLTEDGEKDWRKRDAEFELEKLSLSELMDLWDEGWSCLLDTLQQLTSDDLNATVYIRTKPLKVVEAIHRQLTHYAYHVGQIVHIGKTIKSNEWQSLSIPIGGSQAYNQHLKDEK